MPLDDDDELLDAAPPVPLEDDELLLLVLLDALDVVALPPPPVLPFSPPPHAGARAKSINERKMDRDIRIGFLRAGKDAAEINAALPGSKPREPLAVRRRW